MSVEQHSERSNSAYVETCDELIGSTVGLLNDAMMALGNALSTEHTHPGAWRAVYAASVDLQIAAESVGSEARNRRS